MRLKKHHYQLKTKNTLNNINSIKNLERFQIKHQNLFNAIRAKFLRRNADSDVKNNLNSLKNRNTDSGAEQSDFNNKFKKLYDMAYGKTRDVNNAIAE